MGNPYDQFFDQEVDESAWATCNRCGEEDLFWEDRRLVDEDGEKHVCDHLTKADGFGEVTDDSN